MNLKNSIYKLSFAAMISMMAMNATEIQAQGVVPAQKGEKTFTLEDLNFGGHNYRNHWRSKVLLESVLQASRRVSLLLLQYDI